METGTEGARTPRVGGAGPSTPAVGLRSAAPAPTGTIYESIFGCIVNDIDVTKMQMRSQGREQSGRDV